ncbi:MAG: addiction module toxin, HicA family [Gemmatimonadetes bacterium]|nr:addiction module toxin, HicA family [Gemmatimonadota bacterium]MYC13053.1 addiction module toxin, HicA family [Gemmatimonadota bacterium]MYF16639.1 addiction module toxin, HicA family [Gemmatimonadota bacterium]MYF73621.1 addiction module toxin, HicA family [Gemmatimonadota bacterium]MYK50878.1 addiction module toxin, HicA family [Gemmatimonadota bacterium]
MPRKIRELIADLERANFRLRKNRSGGSHRRYLHPNGPRVTLSGNRGDDAHNYQEKIVKEAIEEAQK